MSAAPEIKGWCPGALRPMASGDGLLLRAKTVGPVLGAAQAQEIAAIAVSCGNGLLDLSQRAQLQLRGVSEATLADALRRLKTLGLLAPDIETESILNIVAPPLAGLTGARFDALDIVRALADGLTADSGLRALPGKFLFLVDDGAAPGLADVAADIRIEAAEDGAALRLAGAEDLAAYVARGRAAEAALALARAFVSLRDGDFALRRMRALTAARGAGAVFAAAGLQAAPAAATRRPAASAGEIFGVHGQDGLFFVGVGAPSGRFRADELAMLAALSVRNGLGELRLTPWRALLMPARAPGDAEAAAREAARLGLIVSPDDPRLAVVACPGAPECPQARGDTRAHLTRLAPLARRLAAEGVGLHITGCAKGCARPAATAATLIAHGDAFDLVFSGRADAAPVATAAPLVEIERLLRAHIEKEAPCPAR